MKLAAIALGTMLSILPMSMGRSQMQHSPTNRSFKPIEQPLPMKIGVVLGGLTLIGAELWWFLGRKQQQQQATQSNGVQKVQVRKVFQSLKNIVALLSTKFQAGSYLMIVSQSHSQTTLRLEHCQYLATRKLKKIFKG
jgi:hypothetical protein